MPGRPLFLFYEDRIMWPNTLERRGFPVAGRRQPVRRTFRPFLEALESRLVLQGAAITSLSTSSVPEGSPGFTLGINGSGFAPGAFVFWNNTILPTTFVNGNQLNVDIPASLLTEDTSMMNGGPVTVSVLQNGTLSNTAQLNIAEAPIAVTGGFGFTGPLITNGTVATFSDTGGAELPFPQDYQATINWGDNSISGGTITGPDQNGLFTVTGNHAYTTLSPYTISVTVTHETSPPVTITDVVNQSQVTTNTLGPITGQELQPLNNVPVVTFQNLSGQPAGAFNATINWGDNSTSTGTVTGPDQNGFFTVTGSHTYAEDGEVEQDLVDAFPVTVTITDGMSATVTTTANIAEENTIVGPSGGPVITGQELQPINNVVVATFGNGNGQSPSAFHAMINWGDGTTSAGTITGPDQNGVFTVTGSHTYAEDGEVEQDLVDAFPVTVTITDGVSATVTTTANIAEENTIVGPSGGPVITGQELQPINNVVVATFGNGNGQSPSAFHAMINWGDGTTSAGTITGPDQNGVFTVTGSHTY